MRYRDYQFGINGLLRRKLVCLMVFVCACLLFGLTAQKAQAKGDSDTATSSFLRISVDARGSAMGDAQGAVTRDVYAMHWNPAGLAHVLFKELGLTYHNAFQDISYSFIGYATPTESFGTVAGQLFFLGSGDIISTYENLDGSFGGTGDTFSVADIGLGISQSMLITERLSYGLSVKLLSHKIMDEQALSIAGDVGVMYQTLIKELKIAATLQNFSTKYKFMTHEIREPWNVRVSSLYAFLSYPLSLAVDYNMFRGQKDALNVGAEYWLFDIIALRAGLKLRPPAGLASGLSAGIGLNLRDIYQFDYSYCPHSVLGSTQRFSIIIRF